MAMVYGLFLLLIAVVAPAVHGVDYTVGGSDGWSQSADLATWAAGKTFTVGDNLVFSYSFTHSLDIVSKDAYDKCTTGKALKSFTDGQTSVPLLKPGPMYFICPTSGHCSSGMKLAITVGGTTTTTPPGTGTGTTTPPGTGTTTPPGTSVLTPPSSGSSSDGSTDGTTTAAPSTKKDSNGSEGRFGHFERGIVGLALVVAGMVSFMG